jgi:large subunit ribosomal protein L10
MSKESKAEMLEQLKDKYKHYSNFIFTDYRGLNVEQITTLRSSLREKEVEYHVVKNRSAKRVFSELGHDDVEKFFIDPTAIAYFNTDISEACKILINAAKDTTLSMKGGLTDGVIISDADIENIAKLPSRQVLIGQTVMLLNSPVSGLVLLLGGVISKFVRTLKAIENSKN